VQIFKNRFLDALAHLPILIILLLWLSVKWAAGRIRRLAVRLTEIHL
jgi:hypothetical protein